MARILEIVGATAGLAGLCVGLVIFVFRDVIRKLLLPKFGQQYAYKILRMLIINTSIVAVVGMLLWAIPSIVVGDNNVVGNWIGKKQ